MISQKYKTIFLHPPKTGGTSVTLAFEEEDPKGGVGKHLPLSFVKNRAIEEGKLKMYQDFFKFTFVRNPYSVLYSFYRYHKRLEDSYLKEVHDERLNENARGRQSIYNMAAFPNFEDFVLRIGEAGGKGIAKDCAIDQCIFHLEAIKQKKYAYIGDEMELDFIGRFENIQKDFELVSKIVGLKNRLPHKNSSGNTAPYWKYYTYESREVAENFFKEDLETFNYSF